MRRAHQLRRNRGLDMSAAMRLAWGEEKTRAFAPPAQEAGVVAALKRYGIDVSRIRRLAAAAVERLASGRGDVPLLPAPAAAGCIEARKNRNGSYSF